MTEFKEKLINEIKEEIMSCMEDCHLLDIIDRNADIEEMELIFMDVLREKLVDVMVIDRNKFKEKLKVVATNKTIGDDCYLARRYNIGLNMCQYIPVDSVCDAAINHIKEEFIARLEECDF